MHENLQSSTPVGPYSPPQAIIAWLEKLESLPSDPDIQSSIDQARAWLEVQQSYMAIA